MDFTSQRRLRYETGMHCAIYRPHRALAEFVSRYWIMRSAQAQAGVEHRVVPNGRVKLLFNVADDFRMEYAGEARSHLSAPVIVGQMSSPALTTSIGRVGVVCVEFHPAGALPFLGAPQHEIAGTVLDLEMLTASRWGRELYGHLRDAPTDEAKVDILNRALLELYDRRPTEAGSQTRILIQALDHAGPFASVAQVADSLGWSPRRLQRRFRDYVGLSPGQMQRILRLQYAFALMRSPSNRPLVDLALDAGYYDQSHFNRDFRALTGTTPGIFFERQTAIAAAFASPRLP